MLHDDLANARVAIAALKSAGTGAPKGQDFSKMFLRAEGYLNGAREELSRHERELSELRAELAGLCNMP
ncbi:MAG: hypothetical protein UY44_C0017G0024 [Candidatus Kaiserbacteria bacterium GW2011_GWA2_49_19]|uniref:Uncharacterized protein n=2 Tax=Candidatus Kaiseribacteriota TaxID=1752734 RepID=A0A0G1VNY4_9BACT|nr:MAG: hypothetical protein UY44_C0017G0024 [Candidatus Kaiserbacteria bacterium GW2011_GWA2_49_19]OGG59203.1 MAG: hypothetical protein A3C86_00435 [Candidatus Kaiserbacteria bacterium RIFCSPHIGHO2_02_FULL_49_16]